MRTSFGRRYILHDEATRDRFLEPSAIWSTGPRPVRVRRATTTHANFGLGRLPRERDSRAGFYGERSSFGPAYRAALRKVGLSSGMIEPSSGRGWADRSHEPSGA
jgi:hypothetical protein